MPAKDKDAAALFAAYVELEKRSQAAQSKAATARDALRARIRADVEEAVKTYNAEGTGLYRYERHDLEVRRTNVGAEVILRLSGLTRQR
jgi:phosphoenolpyruvate-protein kinase (PTS system EI component)